MRTYFARSSMEEGFYVLKDVRSMPVMPIFRRIDKRIRVPAFLCVVGLLFYWYIQRRVEEATKKRIAIEALAERLDRIQVVAMARPGAQKVKVVLQKLDRKQSAVVKTWERR